MTETNNKKTIKKCVFCGNTNIYANTTNHAEEDKKAYLCAECYACLDPIHY